MSESDIEIRLEGTLKKYVDSEGIVLAKSGQTVMDAAFNLGIPAKSSFVAIVNGKTCELNYLLAPGDEVRLIPPISGGINY